MLCHDIQNQLAEYSVGTLSDRDSHRVRDHLSGCADCRREWNALAFTMSALDAVPHREPPRDLWPEISARLKERPRRSLPRQSRGTLQSGWLPSLSGLLRPRRVFAATAVGLVAAVTVAIVNLRPGDPNATGSVAAHASTFVRGYVLAAGERPFSDPVAIGMVAMATEDHQEDEGRH